MKLTSLNFFLNYTSLNLTTDEIDYIISAKSGSVDGWYAVSSVISKRAHLGWTSMEHTGLDVNIYGYGPSVEYFCGNRENTEFCDSVLKIFNWDLAAVTAELRNLTTSG